MDKITHKDRCKQAMVTSQLYVPHPQSLTPVFLQGLNNIIVYD